jgi:thymidine kinase
MKMHPDDFYLEVICGTMFAGKTYELFGRYSKAKAMGIPLKIYRLEADTRYTKEANGYANRDKISFDPLDVVVVQNSKGLFGDISDLISKVEKTDPKLLLIDEAQWYSPMNQFVEYVEHLVQDRHKIVVAAALQTDFMGRDFNEVGKLLALADKITQIYSHCTHEVKPGVFCGEKTTRNQRMVDCMDLNLIGGAEAYQPRCRKHYVKPSNIMA